MKLLRFAGGVEIGVSNAIVHRRETRRVQVPQPSYLNGRRLQGEHEQSISAGMARQIDQNVDLALADSLRELLIIQMRDVLPDVSAFTQAVGYNIFLVAGGIEAIDFERNPVMSLQQRLEKSCDCMVAQIG